MTTRVPHGTRLRRVLVLVPLLASLLAPAGPVRPAAAASPPVLGATNTFTAAFGSAMTVRVPREASLLTSTTAHSPDVDLSGTGRMTGFVLTARHRPDRYKAPTLIAMQAGMCSEPRCRPTAPRATFEYVTFANGLPVRRVDPSTYWITLPAGDYDVRAITDGAPVRMTLRLAGLRGTTAIRLTKRSPVLMRTDSSPPGVAGIDPLRNVAVRHAFRSDLGFTMFVKLEEYEPHVRNAHGTCYYRGDATPPTGKYHPACPGGYYEQRTLVGAPALHYYGGTIASALMFDAGTWTLGHYTSGIGGKSSLTVNSVWLDLG